MTRRDRIWAATVIAEGAFLLVADGVFIGGALAATTVKEGLWYLGGLVGVMGVSYLGFGDLRTTRRAKQQRDASPIVST